MSVVIKNNIGDLTLNHTTGAASLVVETADLKAVTQGAVLIVASNYVTVGDEPDTVITDANLPDLIVSNARYVLTNPFSGNCDVRAEVLITGWAETGNAAISTDGGAFTIGSYYEGNIIVQTGSTYVRYNGYRSGTPDNVNGAPTTAACRVWVFPQKLTGGNS